MQGCFLKAGGEAHWLGDLPHSATLDIDGLLHRTAWAGAGDGVLFFGATGEGKLTAADAAFVQLRVVGANAGGFTTAKTLAEDATRIVLPVGLGIKGLTALKAYNGANGTVASTCEMGVGGPDGVEELGCAGEVSHGGTGFGTWKINGLAARFKGFFMFDRMFGVWETVAGGRLVRGGVTCKSAGWCAPCACLGASQIEASERM